MSSSDFNSIFQGLQSQDEQQTGSEETPPAPPPPTSASQQFVSGAASARRPILRSTPLPSSQVTAGVHTPHLNIPLTQEADDDSQEKDAGPDFTEQTGLRDEPQRAAHLARIWKSSSTGSAIKRKINGGSATAMAASSLTSHIDALLPPYDLLFQSMQVWKGVPIASVSTFVESIKQFMPDLHSQIVAPLSLRDTKCDEAICPCD